MFKPSPYRAINRKEGRRTRLFEVTCDHRSHKGKVVRVFAESEAWAKILTATCLNLKDKWTERMQATEVDDKGRADWFNNLDAEYRRRTGMTRDDAGFDDEVAIGYFEDGWTPTQAVDHQIEKYDLEDSDKRSVF